MKTKYDKNLMRKEYVYALFILKFLLGLSLIWWTVSMTLKSDVGKDDDNAFLSTYHKIDRKYNTIVRENWAFEKKYNIKFMLNEEEIDGLSYEDVFLSQRAIKLRKDRKNIVNIGKNKFTILVETKDGKVIDNSEIHILLTKNTTHDFDIKLNYKNETTKEFVVDSLGYWNITGTVAVNGDKGFFYIKTNAKKK